MTKTNHDQIDRSEQLRAIRDHFGFTKESEFARYLDIPYTSLQSFYKNNYFNYPLIYEKCPELNPHWLLTNEGEMIKNKSSETGTVNTFIIEEKKIEDIIGRKVSEEVTEAIKPIASALSQIILSQEERLLEKEENGEKN